MKNLFAKQSCAKKQNKKKTVSNDCSCQIHLENENHGLWLLSLAMQNATVESSID